MSGAWQSPDHLLNHGVPALLLAAVICLFTDLSARGDNRSLPAANQAPTETLPAAATSLKEMGRGQAVVFSPDIAASGNRKFYESLGFQYWESPSWAEVLSGIVAHNRAQPANRIRLIFLETHGSNGHGLKLQQSARPAAARSYVSLGGLQERLADSGVESVILSACNTGRLFRPEIYHRLNLAVKDKNVLPATRGVINASPGFDPAASSVKLLRRRESRLEQTSEGFYDELPAAVRRELGLPEAREPFVISNLFMQMMLGDRQLDLVSAGYVRGLSASKEDEHTNETIYQDFLRFLGGLAEKKNASASP